MFDINKLYNSHISEIAEIAEKIYDSDGTEKGLSAEIVQEIANRLIDLESSLDERVAKALEEETETIRSDSEAKYRALESSMKDVERKGYDKGFEDGYEDGVAFKSDLEKF